jgi:hypothetical protein
MCYEELANKDMFTFKCQEKHSYHKTCVRDAFKDFIERGEIIKCTCLGGCKDKGSLATEKQLIKLFKKKDKGLVDRFIRLRD